MTEPAGWVPIRGASVLHRVKYPHRKGHGAWEVLTECGRFGPVEGEANGHGCCGNCVRSLRRDLGRAGR